MRRTSLLLLALLAACATRPVAPDAGRPRPDGYYGEDQLPPDATDGGPDGGGIDGGPQCTSGGRTQSFLTCLNQGRSPNQCTTEQGSLAGLCDLDNDGIIDDFEVALAQAYAPVFAFTGGAWGGGLETEWPANATDFTSHSTLVYRPDGQAQQVIDAAPARDTLWQQTVTVNGTPMRAYDAASGAGSDFWLCLNDSSSASRVNTKADMLAQPNGVDVLTVVHPANGAAAQSTHLFIGFGLFFAYNEFNGLDNHEGDWESVAVFVNRQNGAVESAWFDRHDTTDNLRFIDAVKNGIRNPASDSVYATVATEDAGQHGLRFWDYAGFRHHLVAYVAGGTHAMYDYAGNTSIMAVGPRDTHGGDADKYPTWLGTMVPGWTNSSGTSVSTHFFNPGEPGLITLNWTRFKGQWGCTNEAVAQSWPGPFGNARHPRPMFERTWGSPPAP